jgi:thiamine biosynthesis protein ThiI
MKDAALVRYGEIGTKSNAVKQQMIQTLRQRVQETLENEGLNYEKVSRLQGRIAAYLEETEKAAEALEQVPGVKSVSPAIKTEPEMERVKEAAENFSYGESFGVRPNTGSIELSSPEIAEEVGAHVQEFTGAEVDLDEPETWLGVDVREDEAFLFTEKLQGAGGFPTGTQGEYAALISGGIDSPVAAYQMMTRGASVTPVYFYNRPIAAEDHLMRFEASARKLKRFHASKKWKAFIVDMSQVNEELMEVGRGRMILHRRIMFRVAERIAEDEGLNGIVTGESLGQKSSQTAQNLEITSRAVDKPVMRPLLDREKSSISEEARELGTFEEAEIDSACRSLSPENPATVADRERIKQLEEQVNTDELVEQAYSSMEEIRL